jgi:hypothetical protein
MAKQDVTPDRPSHTPGTHRGEDWVKKNKEPGREESFSTARSSTSINPKAVGPIDSRMPHLPPA